MRHAHRIVADIAVEMAQAIYEEAARDNKWYKEHKDRTAFVRRVAPELLSHARETLTDMLLKPYVTDHEKEHIIQILAADQGVPRSKGLATTRH